MTPQGKTHVPWLVTEEKWYVYKNPPQAFHPTGHKSEGLHFQNGTQALSSWPIYSEMMLSLSLGPFPYFTKYQNMVDKECNDIKKQQQQLNDINEMKWN